MVTTADAQLAATVRSLRSHAMTSVTWDRHRGHAESYDVVDIGFNYRMDEPRAALGLSRLPRLEADVANRRAQVRAYRDALTGVPGLTIPWDDADVERSSHFAFAVLFASRERRDAVRAVLTQAGYQTTWYPSITMFSEYRALGPRPRSEDAAARQLVLPMSSSYTLEDVAAVAEVVASACA
jgi:dTDP-4-amino-4,6-dideoxygalactose transaminase